MLFFLCFVAIAASAKSVVFTLSDGTLVYYLLGGEVSPKMYFKEGKAIVNADEYEISDIKNFYISSTDDPNSIEQVLSRASVMAKGNTFFITSPESKTVKVHSVKGDEVKAGIERVGDVVSVCLDNQAKGIYIISIGTSSMKVQKR